MKRINMILVMAILLLKTALPILSDGSDLQSVNPYANEDMQDIIQEFIQVMSSKDEPSLDINDDSDMSELRRIIADRGFNPDTHMSDFLSAFSTLSAASGIFKSGDARRWATLNFVYQLACYQGRGGNMFSKGLWVFATYNGYGCYCGAGEYYGNYLDATDHCCKIHDMCYERVQKKYKLRLGCQTYSIPYKVSCCKDQKITKCTDRGPSAGRELCECDQAMSSCVVKHRYSYNKKYYDNRSKCSTGTKTLSAWEVLKSCKNIFKSSVTYPLTYGSQGSCPAQKKKKRSGWWWGKKDQDKE